jgi:hypothetical protein
MRRVADLDVLNTFTENFFKIVEKHVECIIVSGFVAIISGRTRGTEDVDMIIRKMNLNTFRLLHQDLVDNGFACINSNNVEDIYDILNDSSSVRYTYKNEFLPEMEVKFERDIVDDYQFKTKTKLSLSDIDVYYSSIEMNIAFKEEYLKTPKDIEDATHLRTVYEKEFDESEIVKIKQMLIKYR